MNETSVTVDIMFELPTWNQMIALAKMANRGRSYAAIKRKNTTFLANLFKKNIDVKFKNLEVFIKWGVTTRRTDPDNIASGVKFILDGLVKAEIIPNDGWAQVKKLTHTFSIVERTHTKLVLTGEQEI